LLGSTGADDGLGDQFGPVRLSSFTVLYPRLGEQELERTTGIRIFPISLAQLNPTPSVFFLDASILAAVVYVSREEFSPQPSSPRLSQVFSFCPTVMTTFSCFLSRVDVPVRFGGLFQRVASVYYGSYLSGFDELFEED